MVEEHTRGSSAPSPTSSICESTVLLFVSGSRRQFLLTFSVLLAAHWHHIRTSETIEVTFASMRLRTAETRGCVSRASILQVVLKVTKSAERRWLKLRGSERIAEVARGIQLRNRVREDLKKISA